MAHVKPSETTINLPPATCWFMHMSEMDAIKCAIRDVLDERANAPWWCEGHGTPDRIDALVTVAGGAAMLGWLSYIAPILT